MSDDIYDPGDPPPGYSEQSARVASAAATSRAMYDFLQSEGWKFVVSAVETRIKAIEAGLYDETRGMDDMIFKADKIGSVRELKWMLALPELVRQHAQTTVKSLGTERDD